MSTALVLHRANQSLDRYVAEVSQFPLLDRNEELDLARSYQDDGDVSAAHKLVVSNLRFVVKIAHEYRGYGLKILDLIQEGNIGLMHAVKKFNPDRGYRLISYAVWWIRAQIQSFILRSWSLVKMGTGRARRKLFFKLRSEKNKREFETGQDRNGGHDDLAERLGVSKEEVSEMEVRLAARDFSLDAPLGEDADDSHIDMLSTDEQASPESVMAQREEKRLLAGAIEATSHKLNDKEKAVLERRLLNDDPSTLADIGRELGVSRERARQLEVQVIDKLRKALPAPQRKLAYVSP